MGVKKIFSVKNQKEITICINSQNSREYLTIYTTYLNFDSFLNWKNFALYFDRKIKIPVGCPEIAFCQVGHFILSHPKTSTSQK